LFYLAVALVVVCALLGGGTHRGFLSDAILQLMAIPLLLVALWKLFEVPWSNSTRAALGFCLALAALPILQLIPLPPWLWTSMPGRTLEVDTYEILGNRVPWMPISVSPEATWLTALSLLPPLSIFLATLALTYRDRRRISIAILTVGVISVFIGLIQVAQGPESALRFFQFTTPMEAVGFFANRNHFAAFVYSLILFAAAWTAHATLIAERANRQGLHSASIIVAIGSLTLMVVLLAGAAMARSRAGLGLTMVAIAFSFALGLSDRRAGIPDLVQDRTANVPRTKVLLGAIVLSVGLVVQFSLYRILERFEDPIGSRIDFVWHTIDAAIAYMPFGSGLGTFIPVYATFETAESAAANTFANHAHNEILEVWLETGLFGIILIAAFAFWFATRSLQIWRSVPVGVRDVDWSLVRAATIIVGLVLAHSLVDYPLRTYAMMGVVAFACGLMVEPIVQCAEKEARPLTNSWATNKKQRPKSMKSPSSVAHVADQLPPPSLPVQHTIWEPDIVWPQEWSSDNVSTRGDKETLSRTPDSSDKERGG
jgi:O-antigen ligase